MKEYIELYRDGDRYNPKMKHFNVRVDGGAASRRYAQWILETDRGAPSEVASKYLDMLVLASK